MKNSKEVLQVGNVLIVSVAKENREWGYNPAPDGTRVVVTGFHTTYRGRCGEFGRKPGKYILNDRPTVVTENEHNPVDIGSFHLRREDGSNIPMDLDGVWVSELPKLPFFEGDTVSIVRGFNGSNENVVIVRISYNDINTKCTDGVTPYPIYTISPSMSAGITTAARESDLSLVERGNVWKYYHGESLSFPDLATEAQFYDVQLGRTKDVRNESIGLFSWTIEEAVNAVRQGNGDSISVSAGLFGSKQRPYVKKFLDDDVGVRVREATIQGWSDFDPSNFADEIAEELDLRETMDKLRFRSTETDGEMEF